MPDPGTARPDPVAVVTEGLLHGSVAAELAGVGSGAAAVRSRRSSGTAGPMAEEKERSGEGAMSVFLSGEVVGLHWSRRKKRHLGRRCRRLWRFGMEARSPGKLTRGATRRACCEARSGINVLISKAAWARDGERGVVLASGCMDEGCSFHRHASHIITKEDVNALMKQKCKFKWEMPAEDIPKSKWVGTGEEITGSCDDLSDVKGKLRDHWQKTLSDQLSSRLRFFSLCNSYRDIMHFNKKSFYLKGGKVDSSTMDAYLMHALNHIDRTRDVVIRNDAKLRNGADGDILDDNSYLDQGFTRPKVLFLFPLKSIARRIVKRLIQLSPITQKENAMGQFNKEFGDSDDELEPGQSSKPADFDLLFSGDVDDHFLFGVKYTKKSVKLYSNFYASDIIVASPLALKLKIDGGEHVKGKGHAKENDFDFLSSIEIVVVDHADVISMQNWSHLQAVFEQLNQLPSKEHVTNVMRIRPWYLDQHAQYYRQTIILSSYLTPEMNALFNGSCLNYEGKVKLVTEYTGVLSKIQLEVRQVYERFDASSIGESDDARFDYFCTKVYPKIQDSDEGGVLLFVSSYFEYIRISNFLKSQEASYCRVGEATSQQDISRARLGFFEGKKKILLYSERSHFFHRYKIRGTRHLVIYSLPGRKDFYPELVNMLGESESRKCNVLFSRLDLLKLDRIVGTSSARRLISSDKSMFVFC